MSAGFLSKGISPELFLMVDLEPEHSTATIIGRTLQFKNQSIPEDTKTD